MTYILLTRINGEPTKDFRTVDSIDEGRSYLEALQVALTRQGYLPIWTHNQTALTYSVEEVSELGADIHKIEIGIESKFF